MFWNLKFLLIFDDRSVLRYTIWLCMYCRKVKDVHLPTFIMVVSGDSLSFSAIVPPTLKEWTPTRSGVIPDFSRLSVDTAILRCLIMSVCII